MRKKKKTKAKQRGFPYCIPRPEQIRNVDILKHIIWSLRPQSFSIGSTSKCWCHPNEWRCLLI